MLDDNKHHGLESFEAAFQATLDDGSQVDSGTWKAVQSKNIRILPILLRMLQRVVNYKPLGGGGRQ